MLPQPYNEEDTMKKIEELQRSLSEGRLGRRDFIKQATAMGMAAAIPSLDK